MRFGSFDVYTNDCPTDGMAWARMDIGSWDMLV